MEMVFYCGDCNKFFYVDVTANQISSVCTHCGSETTITCQLSKAQYSNFSDDRKGQWKTSIRNRYPSKKEILDGHSALESILRREKAIGLLFTIKGSRGRTLSICKSKCFIKTDVTVGSVITGNAIDGEKIIFFKHCAGLTIGYLQFETPSMQMNNQSSNFFSENTFTFEETNGITNALMREVFYYTLELIERCASGTDFDVPEYPPLLAKYLEAKL